MYKPACLRLCRLKFLAPDVQKPGVKTDGDMNKPCSI